MKSGRTLWNELIARYQRGVDEVAQMQTAWAAQMPHVDAERFQKTADFLAIQHREAICGRGGRSAAVRSLRMSS